MNRQITGRIATYHFSPTALSKKNLLTEGVQEDKITVTGNTVIDALHIVVDKINMFCYLPQSWIRPASVNFAKRICGVIGTWSMATPVA